MLHIEEEKGLTLTNLSSPEDMLQAMRDAPLEDPATIQAEVVKLSAVEQSLLMNVVEAMRNHLGLEQMGDPSRLEGHGKKVIKQALAASKGCGSIGGVLGEYISAITRAPTVAWSEVVNARISSAALLKRARGQRRPSRKLAAMSRHMKDKFGRMALFPGTTYDPIFKIVVVVDASGSMRGHTDLAAALNEIEHMRAALPNVEFTILYVDCKVTKEFTLQAHAALDRTVTGRGGTDFETAFAHISKQLQEGVKYDMLLYITDGEAPAPRTKLPIPVIWLLTPRGSAVCRDPGHTTIYMRPYSAEYA